MAPWLTPTVSSALMLSGVVPAVLNVVLLYDHRQKPGVVWFLLSMVLGGLWALLFAAFTLAESPAVTLALANVFWAVVPAASVAMFLLAYEYASSTPPPTWLVAALFAPIAVLFALSWTNPQNLVYTSAYHVDAAGVLQFPAFGGVLKVLVVKVYGYLLFTLAAGVFVGEVVRTTGTRRREAVYLLLVFSTLAASTVLKVANLVPIHFDPTTVVFSLSGLAFAVSTHRHGFLKVVPVAREQAFEHVEDAILVVGPSGTVLDANRRATELFGTGLLSEQLAAVLPVERGGADGELPDSVSVEHEGEQRYYTLQRTPVRHARGSEGAVVVLTDVTAAKNREQDLDLFRQVLTRIFRHNLRNDLNVVNGYADVIASNADGDLRDYARIIQSKTGGLIEKTGKARQIERLFTHETTRPLSLRTVVEQAVAEFDDRCAAIEVDVGDHLVSAHPKLELALEELLENAVVHSEDDRPRVRVYTEAAAETVTLYVADDGPGIPPFELDVLDAEEETDLRHGSGIGLWLVYWIAKRSNGDIVSETTDDGSRVGLRLHLSSTDRSPVPDSAPNRA